MHTVTPSERTELADRTRELVRAARRASPTESRALLDEVVTDHLWLADTVARRFSHRGEELDDLVQVARSGLVEAAQRYDPEQGEFVAFAGPTVTGVVKRHFRDHTWLVRPPRQTQELVTAIRREWAGLAQELGSEPTGHELADRLGASDAAVDAALSAGQGYTATSLDLLETLGGAVASESSRQDVEQAEAQLMVSSLLAGLRPDERELLRLRFVEQQSQSQIAERIGVSQMQVSRRLAKLMGRLRRDVDDEDEDDRLVDAVG